MSFVRLLVLPIFRKHWLFHASVVSPPPTAQTHAKPLDWRTGAHLEEKLQIMGKQIKETFRMRLLQTWSDLENAADGTFKNRLYRLAQSVLSREDPQEASLRNIPHEKDLEQVEVIFPASLPERLVRRRLRLLLKARVEKHRCQLIGWSFAVLPLVPLLATPLPNIPLYYGGYRAYSNYGAWQGSLTLRAGLRRLDAVAINKLKFHIDELRHQGVEFPEKSWPMQLLKDHKKYLDLLEKARTRFHPHTEDWQISFKKSDVIEELINPKLRTKSPLTDEAAVELGKHFEIPSLIECVARARRRATGSMFPTHVV